MRARKISLSLSGAKSQLISENCSLTWVASLACWTGMHKWMTLPQKTDQLVGMWPWEINYFSSSHVRAQRLDRGISHAHIQLFGSTYAHYMASSLMHLHTTVYVPLPVEGQRWGRVENLTLNILKIKHAHGFPWTPSPCGISNCLYRHCPNPWVYRRYSCK